MYRAAPPNDSREWFKDDEGIIWLGWSSTASNEGIVYTRYRDLLSIMEEVEEILFCEFWREGVEDSLFFPLDLLDVVREGWPHISVEQSKGSSGMVIFKRA